MNLCFLSFVFVCIFLFGVFAKCMFFSFTIYKKKLCYALMPICVYMHIIVGTFNYGRMFRRLCYDNGFNKGLSTCLSCNIVSEKEVTGKNAVSIGQPLFQQILLPIADVYISSINVGNLTPHKIIGVCS